MEGAWQSVAVQHLGLLPDMRNHHLCAPLRDRSLTSSFSPPGAGAQVQHKLQTKCPYVEMPVRDSGRPCRSWRQAKLRYYSGKGGQHRVVPCVQRQECQWRSPATSGNARRTPSCSRYSLIFTEVPAPWALPFPNRVSPSLLNAAPHSSSKFFFYLS